MKAKSFIITIRSLISGRMVRQACLIFAVVLLFTSGQNIFGFDLEGLIGVERARALLAGENPVHSQFSSPSAALAPRHDHLERLIAAIQQDLNPSVMVETLRVYEKPAAAAKGMWSAAEEAALYNSVLALSTLAGIEYYSASRGTMRTFYESSSVVEGSSGSPSRRELPDPVYPRPPAELTLYARQKDLTFGNNVYQYDFNSLPGAIIFTQENLTSLSYGIIPAVGRNNLRSVVGIFNTENHLLVYAVSMAKAASVRGMNDRIGNSFANRAEAVIKWFTDQADKAYRSVRS